MIENVPHEIEWTDALVERFWAYYSDKTHTYFTESVGREIVRRTSTSFKAGALCIDYGCGSGGLTAALLQAHFKVIAIDFSAESVRRVSDRFNGDSNFLGAYRVGALPQLPVADALYSIETIEHVTAPNILSYFENIRTLLSPTGVAIFSTPNNEDIEAAKVFCPESGARFHPMQHVRSFNELTLSTFLRQNGLEPREVLITDFGLNWRSTPKRWLAAKGKHLLGMGLPPPHLVAIASKTR